jgi:cytochrome c biogenesis protein CcmG/thiol:disulfide interchange protein DsbE
MSTSDADTPRGGLLGRLVPLLVAAALGVLLYVGVRMNSGQDTSALPSPLIGRPAPALDLPTLEMDPASPPRQVALAEFAGTPFVLNVWGSWCPECRVEHPVVNSLAALGVTVVGYNLKDDPDEARRWLQQYGNGYHVIVADPEGRQAIEWGIYGAPETFVVGADGVVAWKHVGALTPDIVREELMPALEASR